jgi:hypothetical protein
MYLDKENVLESFFTGRLPSLKVFRIIHLLSVKTSFKFQVSGFKLKKTTALGETPSGKGSRRFLTF